MEDSAEARIITELAAREPVFHRSEFGTARQDFEKMMATDFCEVGASGRQYSREEILAILEERHRSPVSENLAVSEFACRRIEADTYLVTYTLEQNEGRISRRSSIWRRSGNDWKILFHQGTLISTQK